MVKKTKKRAPGGGRKKLPYETVIMRIPVPLVKYVKEDIKLFKKNVDNNRSV